LKDQFDELNEEQKDEIWAARQAYASQTLFDFFQEQYEINPNAVFSDFIDNLPVGNIRLSAISEHGIPQGEAWVAAFMNEDDTISRVYCIRESEDNVYQLIELLDVNFSSVQMCYNLAQGLTPEGVEAWHNLSLQLNLSGKGNVLDEIDGIPDENSGWPIYMADKYFSSQAVNLDPGRPIVVPSGRSNLTPHINSEASLKYRKPIHEDIKFELFGGNHRSYLQEM